MTVESRLTVSEPRKYSGKYAIFLSLALVALSSCSSNDHEVVGDQAEAVQSLPCIDVVQKTLNRTDQLPGEIQAYQDVAIYPKVPGFIKWIGIDRGSIVKKNQNIIGLIAPELIAQQQEAHAKTEAVDGQLHEAESKLSSAKATLLEAQAKMLGDNDTYTRTKEASETPGVVAPNEVVVLKQTVDADNEKIRAWQENVRAVEHQIKSLKDAVNANKRSTDSYAQIADYLLIQAPFDGYITERNMHVGSFCGPLGKNAYPPIVRIQQLNLLRIVTPVPEVDTGGVVPGAKVEFTVSTHPGERFVGTVARLGNYLEQKTRTMPVELNYWNHELRVLPGMFCEVYWPTRRAHPTLFVPTTAVETTSTLEQFVCLVGKDNKIKWVKVKRGQTMGNLIEVFGDLKEGDIVALKGTDSLKEGTEVKPVVVDRETAEKTPEPRPNYPHHASSAPFTLLDGERNAEYRRDGDKEAKEEGGKAEPGSAGVPPAPNDTN